MSTIEDIADTRLMIVLCATRPSLSEAEFVDWHHFEKQPIFPCLQLFSKLPTEMFTTTIRNRRIKAYSFANVAVSMSVAAL